MKTPLAQLLGEFGGTLILPRASGSVSDLSVGRACFDSRRVQAEDLFCAFEGTQVRGSSFVGDAVAAGAVAVLVSKAIPDCAVPQWLLQRPIEVTAAQVAAKLAGNPSKEMFVAGVTGTNGKTTCVHLVQQALLNAGRSCARLGTLGFQYQGWERSTTNTTPSADEVQNCFAEARAGQASAFVLEASSHGLQQHRLDAIAWDAAVWTNLSRDHLDYHQDMVTYARAKAQLIHALPKEAVAWIPKGDARIVQVCSGARASCLNFSLDEAADLHASVRLHAGGLDLHIEGVLGEALLESSLVGKFNAENLLLSFALVRAAGLSAEQAAQALSNCEAAPGRLQRIAKQSPWALYVDYAHTPDALSSALEALRAAHPRARLGVVFGAGGDRDRGKRAAMGEAVGRASDWCLVTSDNPRTEDPATIVQDVAEGARGTSAEVQIEVDRAAAIRQALAQLATGDVLLVAGKGHEDYQEIDGVRQPFDDATHLAEAVSCLV